MLVMIRQRLRQGMEKLRWYAELIGQRVKAESALIGLLGQAHDLEGRRDEAASRIGYRLLELWEAEGVNPYEDPQVAEALTEIRDLDEEIAGLKEQASLVSEVEA
ncbi:MAG: hypothetical protein KAR83_09950 [Thermodesulfovibrionales bacterium]|nr:hypothetical protein [Thermodesulfovibrionales bacterium]